MSDRERMYLAAVLPLAPDRHPTRILAARRAFLQGDAVAGEHPAAAAPERPRSARDARLDRNALLTAIQDLRGGFWVLPQDDLDASLAQLATTSAPDLNRWVRRLQKTAATRGAFDRLDADAAIPDTLVRALRRLVTESPQSAVLLRRKFLDQWETGASKAAASRIQDHHPEVYAIETEFLNGLGALARDRRLAQNTRTIIILAFAIVIVRVLMRIFST